MVIAGVAGITGVGDPERAVLHRQNAAKDADSSGAGRQIDRGRPALGRKGGDALDPTLLPAVPRAEGLGEDHVAKAEPDSPVLSAGQGGHGRLFASGGWAACLGQRLLDVGRGEQLSVAVARDLYMPRAAEAAALIATIPPQPISDVFAPIGPPLFPRDPHGAVTVAGDAGVGFVVGRRRDRNHAARPSVADACQKDVVVSVAVTVEGDPGRSAPIDGDAGVPVAFGVGRDGQRRRPGRAVEFAVINVPGVIRMGLPDDMDIPLGIDGDVRVDIGLRIGGKPHELAPGVVGQRPRIEVPIPRLVRGLARLLAPDDPQAVLGIDRKLRHPDVGPRLGQRNLRSRRPTAARQPAVEPNLIVPVVVGRVRGKEGPVGCLGHRGEIVARVAGGEDLGAGVAGGNRQTSEIFRVGRIIGGRRPLAVARGPGLGRSRSSLCRPGRRFRLRIARPDRAIEQQEKRNHQNGESRQQLTRHPQLLEPVRLPRITARRARGEGQFQKP